jgi:hypothetical protein
MTDSTELYCAPKIEDDALIIFEENLTADGLDAIIEESKTWPTVAHTPDQYKIVYDEHQRFKRLSLAIRKRAKEYHEEAKSIFTDRKEKIDNDMKFVLGKINPLILKLGNSRQRYDDETEAYKIQAAMIEAERQEAEFKRQELIRATQRRLQEEKDEDDALRADYLRDEIVAWTEYEREKQRLKDQDLANEKARLERERYEFECEKTRLSVDEAKIEAYRFPDGYTAECTAEVMNDQFDIEKTRLDFNEAWEEAHGDKLESDFQEYKEEERKEWHGEKPWSEDDSTPLQDLADFYTARADNQSQKVVADKPKIYGSIEKVITVMEPVIDALEREHGLGLEDERMHAELGNLIARVKMNFGIFKDAVNE